MHSRDGGQASPLASEGEARQLDHAHGAIRTTDNGVAVVIIHSGRLGDGRRECGLGLNLARCTNNANFRGVACQVLADCVRL